MNKKQLISIILVAVLCLGLIASPVFAEKAGSKEESYPFVLVHGLFGFGERSEMNSILPYWGMSSGSLADYLECKGYECYSATVGPMSSAWDRACELYAQLTGTTVDYGIVHSSQKDHERFGITYDAPLFEGWSADKKINLVGHSFGGATIRLFYDILENGRPEEVEAAKAAGLEVSPFFEGGKGDLVYSLTAISAPHNGTTFFDACRISANCVPSLAFRLGNILDSTEYKGLYDLQLEHFGYTRSEDETDLEFFSRIMCSAEFKSHNDNALYDLMIDHALEINDGIGMSDSVYYFSVTGDATHEGRYGNRVHNADSLILVHAYCDLMGMYSGKYTKDGHYIDDSWLPNDGLVNVVSGLYPTNSKGECLKADGSQGFVYRDMKEGSYDKGIWNVLPVQPYDHLSIVGGILSNSAENTYTFFADLIDTIISTYPGGGASVGHSFGPVFKFLDHTKWPQLIYMMHNTVSWIKAQIAEKA